MLIILYVKDEVSYDRFHANVENTYRIVVQNVDKDGKKGRKDGNSGYFQGPRFTKNVPGIKTFVRVQSGYEDIKTRKRSSITGIAKSGFFIFFRIFFSPLKR